jgi:signal transduction histidine kinase
MTLKSVLALLKKSPRFVLAAAILLVLLVNFVDRLTGPELSTSIFYLLPVGLAAWFINRRFGLIFALASAIFWLTTDLATNLNPSHPLIPYWNASVRFGFFLIVVWALSSLRKTREKENEFMGFVVHDLRAPLGNTLTALELLQNEAEESPSQYSKELVEIALTSGRRMLILINTLLDISQLEGGKMPIEVEQVDVAALFTKSVKQVRIMADYKKISLVTAAMSGEILATADSRLTERVLINLLSNAIKFTPAGGQITFSAERQPANQILIGIHDNGPGIPIELEKHVFSRFGQVETPKSGANVGSGLGLTFCKLAVEAQDGRIWLEPNDGRGALIRFTLPGAQTVGE